MPRLLRWRVLVIAAVAVGLGASAHAERVVVSATRRQAFQGFGASQIFAGCSMVPAEGVRDEVHDLVFGELDLAFLRLEIDPVYQATEGAAYDIDAALEATGQTAIIEAALARNPDLKLMYTVVTPPAWMKNNRSRSGRSGSNTLRADCFDDLALYVNSFVADFRLKMGFDIAMVSLQNEADFDAPYDSCVYTAAQWTDLALATRGVWAAYGNAATGLIGPELSGAEPHWWSYIQAQAPGALDGAAWHSYTAGQEQLGAAGLALPHHMTEFSFIEDIDRGERHAAMMAARFCADTNGGAAASWFWWQLVWPRHPFNDGEALVIGENAGWEDWEFDTYTVTRKYHALRALTEAIDPGARQLATTSDSPAIAATAFENPDGTRALVVVNASEERHNVSLLFSELAKYRNSRFLVWRTDAAFEGKASSTILIRGRAVQPLSPWSVTVFRER